MPGPTSTTPKFWFKADAFGLANNTVVTSANAVESSGSGYAFTGDDGGGGLVFKTSIYNGMPTIRSSGSGYLLDNCTVEPRTIVLVGLSRDTPGTNKIWAGAKSLNNGGAQDAYYWQPTSNIGSGSCYAMFQRFTGSGGSSSILNKFDPRVNVLNVFAVRNNGTNVDCFVNGALVSRVPWSGTGISIDGPAAIFAGYFNGSVVAPSNCDISEFALYDVALSDSEIGTDWSTYANGRYATPIRDVNYVFDAGYLYSSWNSDDQTLRLHGSSDGVTFETYVPGYVPPTHSVRDAAIFNYPASSNNFHVLYTMDYPAATTAFGYAKSTDGGKSFTHVVDVDCSSLTGNTSNSFCWLQAWAVNKDNSLFLYNGFPVACINVSSDGVNFKLAYVQPNNAGWTTWDAPTLFSGTGFTANAIAPSLIVYPGNDYRLWWKDQTGGNYIVYSSSSSPFAGYTLTQSGDWAGPVGNKWGSNNEGQSLILLANNTRRVYFDNPSAGNVYYSDAANDDWTPTNWTAKAATSAPIEMRTGFEIFAVAAGGGTDLLGAGGENIGGSVNLLGEGTLVS